MKTKKYKLRWIETLVWESVVDANSKSEALDKLHDDDTQENAEVTKSIDEYRGVEVFEL